MALTYTLKRGATLSLAGTVTLPTPTGAWTGSAQVRSEDLALVEDLTVTVAATATPGTYTVAIAGDSAKTDDWPVGEKLLCDVRFTDEAVPPQVVYSPTFYLKPQQEVTSGGA